jgi:hypothetical protein
MGRVLVGAMVLLVGCTTPVYLRHPDGRTAKCGPYDARPINSFSSAERERGCIQDFKEQGFVRVAE